MDLRRVGEFAFGSAVFACGGLFLALAAERLSAPVAGSREVAVGIVAAVTAMPVAPVVPALPSAGPEAVTARLRHAALADRHSANSKSSKPVSQTSRAGLAQHALPRSLDRAKIRPAAHVARIVVAHRALGPTATLRSNVAHIALRSSAHDALRPRHRLTIAHASAAQSQRHAGVPIVATRALDSAIARSDSKRRNAIARVPTKPQHRYGIAFVRIRPKAERTPEPPIGYDDRPTLLRAEVAADATATAAPVQVELETTHLAR